MSISTISLRSRRWLAYAAATLYVVSFVALAASGVVLWRLYCEGFGCIGKGIAWFIWSAGCAASLLLGYVAQRKYRGAGHRFLRYFLAVQLAAGLALVVYWAAWRAA